MTPALLAMHPVVFGRVPRNPPMPGTPLRRGPRLLKQASHPVVLITSNKSKLTLGNLLVVTPVSPRRF